MIAVVNSSMGVVIIVESLVFSWHDIAAPNTSGRESAMTHHQTQLDDAMLFHLRRCGWVTKPQLESKGINTIHVISFQSLVSNKVQPLVKLQCPCVGDLSLQNNLKKGRTSTIRITITTVDAAVSLPDQHPSLSFVVPTM